ncbi:NAD(P)-binding protein [Thozetella sp. PMI_491]|nr:NAD(P)-binding protein [Thozetella sp. PMI_491]
MAVPSTMRAWTFSAAGPPSSVLAFRTSFPPPSSPANSQLLVQISHAALSSAGLNLMHTVPSPFRRNAIPEIDFSGRVVAVGPSAPAKFAPGTPVFGTVSKSGSVLSGSGVLAEYILIEADCVAVKPAAMRFAEAAGLGCLGQTALEMVRRGGVREGDRVLVHGGSGGVGSVAVQLVKALGGYVVATCSGTSLEFVKNLGAVDEVKPSRSVIDYTHFASLPSHIAEIFASQPFDAVFDTVGSQSLYKASPRFLKADGLFVNVGSVEAKSQLIALGGVPRKYVMFSAPLSGRNAEELANYVEENKLRIFLDSAFALEDVLEAYEYSAGRTTRGTVVVRIGDMDEAS